MVKEKSGFAHVIVFILVIIVAIGAAAFFVFNRTDGESIQKASNDSVSTPTTAPIKHLGFNLDYYNEVSQSAGDIKFTKLPAVEGGLETVFLEYGRMTEANSAAQQRRNPQPTFILPLGTKVRSLVDGEVVHIEKLYSGDYAIHTQVKGNDAIYELEHVINVLVEVGDKVTAGQEVAEVSDYDARNLGGFGLFEIGILNPGNPPSHSCIFDYLDPSIKDETLKKIRNLEDSWELFSNKDDVYDQTSEPVPGCITRNQVEG